MITKPMIGPDQFSDAASTGNATGKQSQTMAKSPQTTAMPLIQMPNLPSDHALRGMSSPLQRQMKMNRQGKVYEKYRLMTDSETRAFQAVVEPIGTIRSNMVITIVRPTARIGTRRVGWTCARNESVKSLGSVTVSHSCCCTYHLEEI